MLKFTYVVIPSDYMTVEDLNKEGDKGLLLCGIRRNGLTNEYIFAETREV